MDWVAPSALTIAAVLGAGAGAFLLRGRSGPIDQIDDALARVRGGEKGVRIETAAWGRNARIVNRFNAALAQIEAGSFDWDGAPAEDRAMFAALRQQLAPEDPSDTTFVAVVEVERFATLRQSIGYSLANQLLALLSRRVAETIPGVHIRAGGNVRLAADGGLIPDVILFRGRAGGKRTEYGFDGPPDLVVEILSPSNRQHDLVGKASAYALAGVPEYWIVDPVRSLLIVGKLVDGTYQRTVYAEGTVPCEALDGAEIDLGFLRSE